jgi:hypothetical protein
MVHTRIKLSALWTSMLFVFAYVDLFSLYRADIRADLERAVEVALLAAVAYHAWTWRES